MRPTIERVNKIAPRHSHLLKEMILVALPTKPLEYTAKNTARRQRIIAHYKAEIDALYQEANRSSLTDLSLDLPQKWDLNSARCFVGTVVKTALGLSALRDDDDFRHNCDSRQGTLVTNTIVRALRDTTRANTNDIADTLLDHYTSINKLATFCVKFAAKASYLAESVGNYEIIVDNMEEMLERFGSNFTERSGCFTHKGSNDDDDVFLVTGTTGFLGATLLGHLLQSKTTRRVYAVNRGDNGGVSLASRQETAFRNLGLPVDLITRDNNLVLVEANISDDRAGLTSALIEEIRTSVTHMLLNAWPTDPDIPLQAFEPTFKSIRTLIDIALSSYRPKLPTVIFVSSMEVASSSQTGTTALELGVNADASTKTGHTQAKWVAESICLNAARTTSLRTRIVRPGRICGSTNGYWPNPGWIQGIVKTSRIAGFLPDIGGNKELSWVPVEDASQVILELLEGDQDGIFHLVHPKPVAASLVLRWIASALAIPMVPPQEWLSHLEHIHTDSDMSMNPESLDEVQWGPQRVNISQCCRSSAAMGRKPLDYVHVSSALNIHFLIPPSIPPFAGMSLEQIKHDRINLARLVRRLEKSTATDEWSSGAEHSVWANTQDALQRVVFAKKLLRNVELYEDESLSADGHFEEIHTKLDRIEGSLREVEKRFTPKRSRPKSILAQLPVPEMDEDEAPAGLDESAPLLPADDLLLPPSEAPSFPSPIPTLLPTTAPPLASKSTAVAPKFLHNTQALHEELSEQLAQMATQLKRNAVHFSESLAKDQAVVEDAQEKLEGNLGMMTKERVRLRDHRGKSGSTTCLVVLSLITVCALFVLMFFVIRFT
ncbi:hypothetical protein CCMSSC00406_0006602 [Pleurotus cornucopiae]|uniref:Uncharacterized protein n=1 Tax=Pleurotus cornucopiae TaxID=5321 RepID=A0ACB7IQ62_PLECO|nr:hypothetical protein CCMSSC00406_0006602 [Pleurotus cornucopiae]